MFANQVNFVWQIVTYPDLEVTCGLAEALAIANKLISKPFSGERFVIDTTFNLTNAYVTPILMRLICFEGDPIFPISFYVHERKLVDGHCRNLRLLQSRLPNMKHRKSNKLPWIVDREPGLVQSAKEVFAETINLLFCWNHIIADLKHFLKQRSVSKAEISFYSKSLRKILCSATPSQFDKNIESETSV